ncbi:SDR family NAD(P)-dependent oxidoreductase [Streptomyces griseoviridis]|uniref:Oxidoreductase n=1 Tax=Streptomyces griseoviridis TaxID=45398 RepID=A0A3Q9KVC9_STRGD|nr:SDR family NAD(P)-dependent oxidoreductase [Streptomyces griseoviridis]AZS85466.1 SDR family NAD(P)-dependent oxidoreductase [Streptomyces griseoviridis]QCN87682.1 oxidoreductase [Streptomyces griseoviridis]
MSTVLITGAATGIGNLTAKALARAGHRVHATMRSPEGRNAPRAQELRDIAAAEGVDLRVAELDVSSQESADAAVVAVLADGGDLDVVIHNAGHLLVGYVEAFTAEEMAHLIDVNTLGVQRLNRAALPHLRRRGSGTLLYVGSTTSVTTPPFLGPYVVSKAAMDSLALVTSYEVAPLGIETVIVMPGAFTEGTDHFPKAGRAADTAVAEAYQALDPLVARNEEATASLFTPGTHADPVVVAEEITRILALPYGERPFRSVVDLTNSSVEQANDAVTEARTDFVRRMGFGEVLELRRA